MSEQQLSPDQDGTEIYYAEMEAARNDAEDAYFKARPQLLRSYAEQALFRAGFERAFQQLWNRLTATHRELLACAQAGGAALTQLHAKCTSEPPSDAQEFCSGCGYDHVSCQCDDDYDDELECTWCGGEGIQENDDPFWHGFDRDWIPCECCNGTGLRKYQTVF